MKFEKVIEEIRAETERKDVVRVGNLRFSKLNSVITVVEAIKGNTRVATIAQGVYGTSGFMESQREQLKQYIIDEWLNYKELQANAKALQEKKDAAKARSIMKYLIGEENA